MLSAIVLMILSFILFSGCDVVTNIIGEFMVTISYSSKYGDCPGPKTVMKGYALTKADLPELEYDGWIFKGWDKEAGDIINENTTITASWKEIDASSKYTITYVSSHGTAPASKIVEEGYTLTSADLPELSAEGWKFKGWNKSVGDKIFSNTIITAYWEEISENPPTGSSKYTIKYYSEYGQKPENKVVPAGYKLTIDDLPVLYEKGIYFDGWDKSVGYTVNSNITIYAKWIRLKDYIDITIY